MPRFFLDHPAGDAPVLNSTDGHHIRRSLRMLVGDTDKGAEMRELMEALQELVQQYRTGAMKERYD